MYYVHHLRPAQKLKDEDKIHVSQVVCIVPEDRNFRNGSITPFGNIPPNARHSHQIFEVSQACHLTPALPVNHAVAQVAAGRKQAMNINIDVENDSH